LQLIVLPIDCRLIELDPLRGFELRGERRIPRRVLDATGCQRQERQGVKGEIDVTPVALVEKSVNGRPCRHDTGIEIGKRQQGPARRLQAAGFARIVAPSSVAIAAGQEKSPERRNVGGVGHRKCVWLPTRGARSCQPECLGGEAPAAFANQLPEAPATGPKGGPQSKSIAVSGFG
jgi:hypothetical protein